MNLTHLPVRSSRPYAINLTLLFLALLMSVAIGAVFIPPGIIARVLGEQLAVVAPAPDLPQSFKTILYQIRLPHTILIAVTGAALGGSGAVRVLRGSCLGVSWSAGNCFNRLSACPYTACPTNDNADPGWRCCRIICLSVNFVSDVAI